MARNRFLQWAVLDWPAKILALTAAVLLFFLVQFLQVEVRTITVRPNVDIPVLFTPDPTYIKDVQLTLRGSERDIYYVKPEDLKVTIDLSFVESPGLHTADITIEKSPVFNRLGDIEIIPDPEVMTVFVQQRPGLQ
jgi:YbbR domain-containing protein